MCPACAGLHTKPLCCPQPRGLQPPGHQVSPAVPLWPHHPFACTLGFPTAVKLCCGGGSPGLTLQGLGEAPAESRTPLTSDLTNTAGQGPAPPSQGAARSSTSSCQGHLLDSATAALPADDQSLLAKASCTLLQLVSYVRRMVGVPYTGEPWLWGCSSPTPWQQHWHFVSPPVGCCAGSLWSGQSSEVGGSPAHCASSPHPTPAFPNIIHPCDELGTPKLLFQVTSLSKRTSKFLQACGTYYMCRVEFGAPGRCPGKWSPRVPGGPGSAQDGGAQRAGVTAGPSHRD